MESVRLVEKENVVDRYGSLPVRHARHDLALDISLDVLPWLPVLGCLTWEELAEVTGLHIRNNTTVTDGVVVLDDLSGISRVATQLGHVPEQPPTVFYGTDSRIPELLRVHVSSVGEVSFATLHITRWARVDLEGTDATSNPDGAKSGVLGIV